MKKEFLYLIITSLLIFSCSKNQKNVPIYLYALQNKGVQNLELNSNKEGDFQNFEYFHLKDSIKNINLKYHLNKDILLSATDTFYPTKSFYKSKSYDFKLYQNKQIENNTTLVFNADYGLFATLVYEADFLFLKDSISEIEKEIIYKQLFLNLNTINLE